jgi:hypothetical protein
VGSCPQSLAWFVATPAGWFVENPDGKSDEKMHEMDGLGVPPIFGKLQMFDDFWENLKF